MHELGKVRMGFRRYVELYVEAFLSIFLSMTWWGILRGVISFFDQTLAPPVIHS